MGWGSGSPIPSAKVHSGCFWQVTHSPFSREGGLCSSEVGVGECGVLLGDRAEAFDDVDKILLIYVL